MAYEGMDTDAGRQLAASFSNSAGRIREISGTLHQQLHSLRWDGPDHGHFLNNWDGHVAGLLNQVAQALDEAHGSMLRNVQQQENASNAS